MKAKPFIYAALGARGTGKSAWTVQTIDKLAPPRLAIWDLMQEHGQGTADLAEAIRAMKAPRFRSVFRPSRDDKLREKQFELWCRAVLAARNVTAWVEELAFVTTPWQAPTAWREMVLLGRHAQHRVSIIATSQRPAQIDKDFLGSCDLIHVGRLAHRADAKVAADVLGVDYREVLQMPDLAYVERNMAGNRPTTSGTISFGAKPLKKPASAKEPKGANLPAAPPVQESPAPSETPAIRVPFNPLEHL